MTEAKVSLPMLDILESESEFLLPFFSSVYRLTGSSHQVLTAEHKLTLGVYSFSIPDQALGTVPLIIPEEGAFCNIPIGLSA